MANKSSQKQFGSAMKALDLSTYKPSPVARALMEKRDRDLDRSHGASVFFKGSPTTITVTR
jgi:hypothetical protein